MSTIAESLFRSIVHSFRSSLRSRIARRTLIINHGLLQVIICGHKKPTWLFRAAPVFLVDDTEAFCV